MHGRIMFINPATETGMIVGADRNRYQFSLKSWEEDRQPARNMEVSFATELYRAVNVRQFDGTERTVDIFPEQPMSRPEPGFEMPEATARSSADDLEHFRDRMDTGETDNDDEGGLPAGFGPPEPQVLQSGEIFPELEPHAEARPAYRATSPLFQAEPGLSRPGSSIRYYAIGIAGSIVLVVLAYAAVHL